jgi:hypothetical protein
MFVSTAREARFRSGPDRVGKFWDWEANNVILFQSTPLYPLKFPPVFSELFYFKKKKVGDT